MFQVILDARPDEPMGSSPQESSLCAAAWGSRCLAGGTRVVTAELTLS